MFFYWVGSQRQFREENEAKMAILSYFDIFVQVSNLSRILPSEYYETKSSGNCLCLYQGAYNIYGHLDCLNQKFIGGQLFNGYQYWEDSHPLAVTASQSASASILMLISLNTTHPLLSYKCCTQYRDPKEGVSYSPYQTLPQK